MNRRDFPQGAWALESDGGPYGVDPSGVGPGSAQDGGGAPSLPRRLFLKSSFAAGVWTLGCSMLPAGAADAPAASSASSTASTPKPAVPPAPPAPPIQSPFDAWLSFAQDGTVTANTTVSSLGQGTHTVIAQLVAEELEMPLELIRVQHCPVEKRFHREFPPGITTFASRGLQTARGSVGQASAAAREMLVRAAAQEWKVEPATCTVGGAQVSHPPSGRALPYAKLFAAAAKLTPPDKAPLKPSKDWKVLGKSQLRTDIPARVDGSAVFGIDVKLPGMLVAAVRHAPTFGGTLASVDEAPALAVRGVRKVVRLPNAVAVVADGWWPAQKAAALLKPVWKPGPHAKAGTDGLRKTMLDAVRDGRGAPNPPRPGAPKWLQDADGTAQALASAAKVIDTTFDVPFLAHAAMEPLNATVAVSDGRAELWFSTQGQTDTQRAVAKALGIALEKVVIHTQDAGGGFGRRLEHDWVVEAALVAKAVGGGVPVKTIWSRVDDMRSGYYRPATAARMRLALDGQHMPLALRADVAGPSLLEYTGATNSPANQGFDWTYTMGLLMSLYTLPKLDLRWSRIDIGVPCGYFRSVGDSQNCFFLEHSIELAAREAKEDPLAYRRRMVAHNRDRHAEAQTEPAFKTFFQAGKTRALALMDAMAEKAGWSQPLPKGHFRGMALNDTVGTFGGHMVEIEVTKPGQFRLVRIIAAVDAGVAANPKVLEAQVMGGTLFGLSAALTGEITVKDGQVQQGNFDSYPVLTLAQVPPLEVVMLSSGPNPTGVGEVGPPTIMAALANALLAAGGKPITRLPLTRSGWRLAT